MKIIFIFIINFLFNIYFYNNVVFSKEERCVNYLAGVGRFDITIFTPELEGLLFKGRYHKVNYTIPAGWTIEGNREDFNINYYLDRKIKPNYPTNSASFYFELDDTKGNKIFYIRSFHIWLSSSSIATETRNYYPQYNDQIKIKFKYRLDELQNATITFRVVSVWQRSDSNTEQWVSIGEKNISINRGSFISDELIARLPFPNEISNSVSHIIRLLVDFKIYIHNNNYPKKIKFWIDDVELYTYRNNSCIELPTERRMSFLKFFEVFGYKPDWDLISDRDFIKLYIDNIKLTNTYGNIYLINKELDPEFNYTFYISPSTLHRYRKYNTSTLTDKYRTPKGTSEFINHLDDLQIPTTTDVPHNNGNHPAYRIHFNARFPEILGIRRDNLNLYDYPYRSTRYMISVTDHRSLFNEMFKKYIFRLESVFFMNSPLSPRFYFIDNYTAFGSRSWFSSTLNYIVYFSNIFKNLSPLREYIVNLGYTGLSYSLDDSKKKFNLGGYMNEGWLYNPESLAYQPRDNNSAYNLFARIINNNDLRAIMLISPYPYYNNPQNAQRPDRNCTDTDPIIRSVVSAFYLVNNHNVYFALVPGGTYNNYVADKYSPPQCYTKSMFLNIGRYHNVNNINEMIIGTTSDGWYVYERRYERGLIVFNSSPTSTFTYRINWQNLPFDIYKEYFSNVIYSTTSNSLITIPRNSGIILYNDENIR